MTPPRRHPVTPPDGPPAAAVPSATRGGGGARQPHGKEVRMRAGGWRATGVGLAILGVLAACRGAPSRGTDTGATREGHAAALPPVVHGDSGPGGGTPARATPALDDGFGLAVLLEAVAAHNPRLAAAQHRWLAARERPAQARAWPDPMLGYVEMLEPVQTRVGPNERAVQLSQRIPFPPRLEAAGAAAAEEARVRELDYHIALRDTVAEAKVTYAELVYLHRAAQLVRENHRLATLLAAQGAAAQGGEPPDGVEALTLFDVLRAESAVAQLAYDAVTLEELLEAERAKLNGLLDRAPGAPIGTPAALRFRPLRAGREELHELALARRQEIQAAIHRVRAAHHARRLARLAQVPDLTVGVQRTFIGDASMPVSGSGEDAIGLQLGISLPVWGAKNRARIAEAEHAARAAGYEREAQVADVGARLGRLYFRLKNAERLVRLYGDSLIPQAAQALYTAEEQHKAGREPFARLLEARSVWLNFHLAHQRALSDHEEVLARLEQLVGTGLESLREDVP